MSERRKRRRFAIEPRMEARLYVNDSETKGFVLDVNAAGAFIATDLVLETNSPLRVELCVPDADQPLVIRAVVARCAERREGPAGVSPAGLGIMFMADSDEEEMFIQRAVIVALEYALEKARSRLSSSVR